MSGGRPRKEYNHKQALTLIEHIENGQGEVTWCSQEGNPSRHIIDNWEEENPEFRTMYARAKTRRGEYYAEKINQVRDDVEKGKLGASEGRVIIDTLKWQAAKFYPKMFNDKQEVDVTSGGQPIQMNGQWIPPKENDK
jgi:hypothetical protein